MNTKTFFRCEKCGNIMSLYHVSGVPVMCCDQKMTVLVPNSTEAAGEKHVPVVTVENGVATVVIGSVMHPMTPEHLITWVYLLTDKGGHEHFFTPEEEPVVKFNIGDEKVIAAYEYCNIHGLWSASL